MADLDYAFLADYAAVENGRLTAVGASYTHATVARLEGGWVTAVAGRLRTKVGAEPVQLNIVIGPESGIYSFRFEDELRPDEQARPYGEGTIGVLFASLFTLPILVAGMYKCDVYFDGVLVRTLRFELEVRAD